MNYSFKVNKDVRHFHLYILHEKAERVYVSEHFKITEPISGSKTSAGLLKQYLIKTIKFTNSPDNTNVF